MLSALFERIPKTGLRIGELSPVVKFAAFTAVFITPLYNHIGAIIFFLILDMITSIYAQYKIKKKRCNDRYPKDKARQNFYCLIIFYRTIEPKKLLESVEKIFGYALALIVCFVFDGYFIRKGLDATGNLFTFSVTNTVFLLIMGAEALSIIRNLGSITRNPIFAQIEKILRKDMTSKINFKK
jgi:hypothetical protein